MKWGLSLLSDEGLFFDKAKPDIEIDDVLKKGKEISDYVNNVLINYFYKIHNIDSEFGVLKVKQEIVARTSYFLDAKKKYCMHIVNKNGAAVDSIFIRGIVVRRSDYPIATKEKILELVKLLLSVGVSRAVIDNFIEDTFRYMENLALSGDYRIGKPVSYGRSDYIRKPPHVLGMELWNVLEYNYFYPGTKGYMFRLKSIDISDPKIRNKIKLSFGNSVINYIVMPMDVKNLPKRYNIDVDSMVRFAWKDRVKEIIDVSDDIVRKRIR